MQNEQISLYFKGGSSDKVYHAQLEKQGEGYVVNFQYGRRGAALTAGSKTLDPVDYAVAKKAYDKIVKEKLSKGYSPGEAGAAFQGSNLAERFTGITPQLLNLVDESAVQQLLDDDAWAMQEKYDGVRRLIRATAEEVVGINKMGLAVPLPQVVVDALEEIRDTFPLTLDGELVGDKYFAFDMLEVDGRDLREKAFSKRLFDLSTLGYRLRRAYKTGIRATDTSQGSKEKRAAYAALKAENKEGAVFKRLSSVYVPGRPASGGDALKRKFTKSASVVVEKCHDTRRSVSMAVLEETGRRVVGNVTIPANQPIPPAGAVIEVEYLYAYPTGSLFQPVFKGVRDDVTVEECLASQLVAKAGPESEDDE